MADLSLNLEIKGIGSTQMSMDDAQKLYRELKVLFEEKVVYVGGSGWNWNYPWWSIYGQQYTYSSSGKAATKSSSKSFEDNMLGQMSSASSDTPSAYTVKF